MPAATAGSKATVCVARAAPVEAALPVGLCDALAAYAATGQSPRPCSAAEAPSGESLTGASGQRHAVLMSEELCTAYDEYVAGKQDVRRFFKEALGKRKGINKYE